MPPGRGLACLSEKGPRRGTHRVFGRAIFPCFPTSLRMNSKNRDRIWMSWTKCRDVCGDVLSAVQQETEGLV